MTKDLKDSIDETNELKEKLEEFHKELTQLYEKYSTLPKFAQERMISLVMGVEYTPGKFKEACLEEVRKIAGRMLEIISGISPKDTYLN